MNRTRAIIPRRSRMRPLAVATMLGLLIGATVAARASASAASGTVVLGSSAFAGPNGSGWGTAHPSEIFNGGDPSGLVSHIRWSKWGQSSSTGQGLTAIFKPKGGYYSTRVPAQLRAYDLGRCTAHGPLAYQRLMVREPSRPGGPFGRWFAWSGAKTLCRYGF